MNQNQSGMSSTELNDKLRPGVYAYDGEDKDVFFIITASESDSALKLKMIENSSYFTPNHFDMMFHGKRTITVRKKGSPHHINKSGNDWFCIYPFRSGIPYPFRMVSDT